MTKKASFGQRVALKVASTMGSWRFIIVQSIALIAWVVANMAFSLPWDPYPFILLNLVMSLQAAYTAPMILMSQNRQAAIDRSILHHDLRVDTSTNHIIQSVHHHLEWQDDKIEAIINHLGIQMPPKPPKPKDWHNGSGSSK